MLIKDVKPPYDAELRQKLLNLIVLAGPTTWRKSIVDASVNLSSEAGPCPTGDPLLHSAVGELLAKEGDLDHASVHLLSACSRDAARTLADVMFTWSKEEKEGALGRYAARGVLGYLEIGGVGPARVFLEAFLGHVTKQYPALINSSIPSPVVGSDLEIRVTTVPSLNFLQLLVLTCQVGAGGAPGGGPAGGAGTPQIGKAAYQAMVGRYSRSVGWMTAAGTKESLAVIAEIYVGIKCVPTFSSDARVTADGCCRPPRQGGNILGDLMGSLFGGGAPPAAPAAGAGRGRGRLAGGAGTPKPATPGLD